MSIIFNLEMNRGREALNRFLGENFGATLRNVTVWIMEDVSEGMKKGIRELRRAESGNKHNRRISQLIEDYEKLKERLDEERKMIESSTEHEDTRMDVGIDIQEDNDEEA